MQDGAMRLARFAWFVVAYNLLVILFGAWVRITGSGAGCGAHWPTCNGEVILQSPELHTVIEYTHRLTSGLCLVLALLLVAWVFAKTDTNNPARRGALFMTFFILLEAIIGAGLVVFHLVEKNDSMARAIVIAVHLVNTLGLLASGALTAYFLAHRRRVDRRPVERRWLFAGLLSLLFVSATGAVTALGDTLFPVDSLEEAARAGHFLIRLRIVHPVLAVLAAVVLTLVSRKVREASDAADSTRAAKVLVAFTHIQVLMGVGNIVLRAPGAMQIVHLLMANLVWLALVLTCAARFFPRETQP
jgi:heme a synthase